MSEFRDPVEFEPNPAPAPRPSRRSALLLWALAGAGLILTSLLGLPLSRAMRGVDPQVQTLIYNLFYYLLFAALPLCLLARRRPGLWLAFRPYPISIFSVLSVVALALLGVFLVTDLGALWAIALEGLGLRLNDASIAIPSGTGDLALCVLCVAVIPAVCEEFVFRGAILSALEPRGTRRAVWIAALLFALLHGSVEGLPMQLLVGGILGWLVVYCDSIYAGLIYHTVHNAASILLEYAILRNAGPQLASATQYVSALEAVGGRAGVLQLLGESALLGAMMFLSMRMFRMTARLRGVALQAPQPGEKLRASEWVFLLLGLLFAGLLLGSDLLSMLPLGGAT